MGGAAAGAADGDDRLVLRDFLRARRQLAQGDERRAPDMTQGTRELGRLAHVDDLHLGEVLLQPVRLDLPDAAEGEAQRGPARLSGRRCFVPGLAAAQIGGHRLVDLLRVRQVEVLHVSDIVAFADLAAQPGIEPLLLGDAADREATIIVCRIEQAVLGQREDARADRAIEGARIALLEVGAAGAADQQAIAGEGHALIVEHIGDAARGVAGRRPDLERPLAELDAVAVLQQPVGPRRARRRRQRDATTQPLVQEPGAGHMVGVDVGIQRPDQRETELADQRRVAPRLLEYRIDQQRLFRDAAAEQIGVGRRGRIEELAEHEHRPSPLRPARWLCRGRRPIRDRARGSSS